MVQEHSEEQDEEMDEEELDEHDEGEDDQENHYEHQDEREVTPLSEPARPLGQFMTPQIPRISKQPRLSLGPGAAQDMGPRRVRVVAPWKVNEIQVPVTIKEESAPGPSTSAAAQPSTPLSPVKREKVTDEEREVSARLSRLGNTSIKLESDRPFALGDAQPSRPPTTSSRARPQARAALFSRRSRPSRPPASARLRPRRHSPPLRKRRQHRRRPPLPHQRPPRRRRRARSRRTPRSCSRA